MALLKFIFLVQHQRSESSTNTVALAKNFQLKLSYFPRQIQDKKNPLSGGYSDNGRKVDAPGLSASKMDKSLTRFEQGHLRH